MSTADQDIANAILQSQQEASKNAFNVKYDPGNAPQLFQSDPSLRTINCHK